MNRLDEPLMKPHRLLLGVEGDGEFLGPASQRKSLLVLPTAMTKVS